jgi:prolyl-tRNA editing enzyme YbaK/EbsC (Cys-tRNA(Pro) deacylase)
MPVGKLREALDAQAVKYVTISHSPAYTAQEIAALAHVPGRELAKTAMLSADDDLCMAVLPASFHVDLEKLRRELRSDKLDLAHEADVKERSADCEVGAMPPFGNLWDVPVFVDQHLVEDETELGNDYGETAPKTRSRSRLTTNEPRKPEGGSAGPSGRDQAAARSRHARPTVAPFGERSGVMQLRDPQPVRLPSEAEWECACRGGTGTEYWSGDEEADLAEVGWYDGNSGTLAHSVAEKPANPFGLFDMHGNVDEWCEDRWHNDYEGAPDDGSAWVDGSSPNRVRRGGCWSDPAGGCRSAIRHWGHPSGRYWEGLPWESEARGDALGRGLLLGIRPAISVLPDD